MVEQIFVYFIFRVAYFQSFVLVPQTKAYAATTKYVDQNLVLQINALKLIACIVLAHIGLIIFGMIGDNILFLLFLLYRTPRWSTTKTSIYRETQRGKILKKKKKFQ
jgi:hypothetical protein